jgi:hypothetical protein
VLLDNVCKIDIGIFINEFLGLMEIERLRSAVGGQKKESKGQLSEIGGRRAKIR